MKHLRVHAGNLLRSATTERLVGGAGPVELGIKRVHTARWMITGYKIMKMARKRPVTAIAANSIPKQAAFIAPLFGVADRRR